MNQDKEVGGTNEYGGESVCWTDTILHLNTSPSSVCVCEHLFCAELVRRHKKDTVFHFQSSFIMKNAVCQLLGSSVLSQTIKEFSKDCSHEKCKIENGNVLLLHSCQKEEICMNYEFRV